MTSVHGAHMAMASSGVAQVTGALTLATVGALWKSSMDVLAQEESVTIDLSGITHADSAGLALLLEWRRAARLKGRSVRFTHIPAQLRAMARVSSVDEVLGFEE